MALIAETDIAVIGMGCRFPGASNPSSFWKNLIDGRECITFFSREELLAAGHDTALLDNPSYVTARGVLDNIEKFDASLFDMTPVEAAMTDPQHRLFLECAWEAMEDGGYDGSRCTFPIGVYGGCGANSYLRDHVLPTRRKDDLAGLYQMVQANGNDFLATKTAYKLNLTGPAITIQTACSTSLVAVHCGCQAIINGECDMALAGGVSIFLPQKTGYLYQEGMILSADGHCRAFDASASGTVMGSGAGVVLLKRLEDAVLDGDCVYGVIKGGAVNNDGAAKVGFTAPGVEGQIRVIREAQAVSGVSSAAISYVETHGTATPMGDPIEIEALRRAFGTEAGTRQLCRIGSVKTNIGHCDAASGIAGLIKTLLSLKHGMIPPSLNFEKPNPVIDFAATPFQVCTTPARWEDAGGPRVAGVSSFGMGGTNAHLIVQQAPVRQKISNRRGCSLIPLSGKSADAVTRSAHQLAGHIAASPEDDIADIAFTLQNGRRELNHRTFFVCSSREEARAVLSASDGTTGHSCTTLDGSMSPVITFMFPGQGSQYVGMGQELYATEKVFRDAIDQCAEIVRPVLGCDPRKYILQKEAALAEELQQTAIAQPVLFCVEYAYAMLLTGWGILPQSVIGHSLGEYVAACIAGIFSLPDALRLVAARGALMQRQPKGMMVAVMMAEEELEPLVHGDIALAAVNGSSCTLSGPDAAMQELLETCTAKDIPHVVLKTSHAFHSSMFDSAVDEFASTVEAVSLGVPKILLISNLTGQPVSVHEATDPFYWGRHLRHTVRFGDGLATLLAEPNRLLVEVGPGRTLSGIVLQNRLLTNTQHVVATGCHARDESGSDRAMFGAVGSMWSLGVSVDWQQVAGEERSMRISLPTYPFEREVHWLEAGENSAQTGTVSHGLLPVEQWFNTPGWRRLPQPERERCTDEAKRWVLLSDDRPLAKQIARGLHNRGCQLSTVILEGEEPDAQQLGELLNSRIDASQLHILYLPSLQPLSGESELPERALRFTIALAKALEQQQSDGSVLCDILATGMYDIIGEEQLIPANASLVAAVQSLSREYPFCHCRCIDCGYSDTGKSWPDARVVNLVDEIISSERQQTIALRGGHRWQEQYEPVPLCTTDSVFRENGTYLITGGLGDIGLAFADYISRHFQVNLALTGKSSFPHQHEWADYVEQHGAHSSHGRIIGRLTAIQDRGSRVINLSADVCSHADMQAVVDQVERRFGQIDGCIHGAGITGAEALGPYSNMTIDTFCRVLAPKYRGYCVLRDIMQDRSPDFLIALSSLAAILGGTGMGSYGAANAVMAAHITADNRTGSRWLAVDWDGWRFTGNTVEPAGENIHLRSLIPAAVGAEQLALLAGRKHCERIAVSTTDLNRRLHWWNSAGVELCGVEANTQEADHISVGQDLKNVEEEMVATIWRSVLGTPSLNRNDSFFSLGGNSLQITQAHSRLKESLGVEFPLRSLFEAPRLKDMAALVRQYTKRSEHGGIVPREEMEF
jgi:acyl transferase domain-containing protein